MTPPDAEAARVLAAAAELLARLDAPDLADATLAEPLQVQGPRGLDSWVVPLAIRGAVVGFLHLEPDLRLHRVARLAGGPTGSDAQDWFDRAAALRQARAAARVGDLLGEPVLTYHRSRDRIAWRVPIVGRPAVIWVAGSHAFEDTASGGDGER